MTFSLFHRKFENGPFLAKNGPKSAFLAQNAQKWGVFSIFSKTAHWNFLIFCRKPSLCSPKNITALVFQGNLKNGPFWPKLTQIWPKFGHLARWNRLAKIFFRQKLKNSFNFCLFFKIGKKIFKGKTSTL